MGQGIIRSVAPTATAAPIAGEAAPRVVQRFRAIYAAMKAQPKAEKAGLASAQAWALSVIASSEQIGVSSLAAAMGIHQSTASNLLRPLMERGLVASSRSAEDGRAVHLRVTAKGKRQLKQAPGPFGGALTEAVAQLDATTLRRLDRDLGQLLAILGGPPRDDDPG